MPQQQSRTGLLIAVVFIVALALAQVVGCGQKATGPAPDEPGNAATNHAPGNGNTADKTNPPPVMTEAERQATAFFEANVRPVLMQHCYKCHSEAAGKNKGRLTVDTREAIRKGGRSGPAVVPHDVAASLLYKAISYTDEDLQMPPAGKLPDDVIDSIRQWIETGAVDPRGPAGR